MKIIKYLIAALLIISITKKVHVAVDELEFYDAKTKTAQMSNGDMYVGIMEYNQATTPPNVLIPSLKLFTQISTQNYTKSSTPLMGGVMPTTSLYGIQVIGANFHIKSKNKTIGTYWPMNKVAQLSNGQTYVAIIEEKVGNYKKHGFYATGPIWTQFDAHELATMYNISTSNPDFKSLVKKIGTVQKQKQTYVLYGVLLYQNNMPSTHNPSPVFTSSTIEKETKIPGMDHFTKDIHDRAFNAYQDLLKHTDQPKTRATSLNPAGIYFMQG